MDNYLVYSDVLIFRSVFWLPGRWPAVNKFPQSSPRMPICYKEYQQSRMQIRFDPVEENLKTNSRETFYSKPILPSADLF